MASTKAPALRMSAAVRILVLAVVLLLGIFGVTSNAIETDGLLENEPDTLGEANDDILSRSDYPDLDDLSSFFDFEIGPPHITYRHLEDGGKPRKAGYYRYSADHAQKKQVVTPGSHYKSSTEKTFVEEDSAGRESNESRPFLQQAKIGNYQVSIVDAGSPLLTELGLGPGDLEKLTGGHAKHGSTNATMLASDSTDAATYAENPRPPNPPPPPQQQQPAYPPPYDSSNYPAVSGERRQGGYAQLPSSSRSPPQGSYDPKPFRPVQQGGYAPSSGGYGYSRPSYSHPPPHATYSQPPPSYSSPPQSYGSHAQSSYDQQQPGYGGPPSSPSYGHGSSSYGQGPQRSSEPWRQSSHVQVDWDDKSKHQDGGGWKSGNYPPHPPPLPYSSTSSGSGGSYHPKPSYGGASYHKQDSGKATYSTVSSGPISYKPSYHPSSSYTSSSKGPTGSGSENYAASSHYEHPAPASKPGITIRFKAKSPGGHGGGHHGSHGGVSIPLSFNPLEIVKKILPSLNPLNNKKVTIGITIENKKDHHHEIHAY